MDESTNHIPQAEKDKAVKQVIELYDRDGSGTISFAEFTINYAKGVKLPDFGKCCRESINTCSDRVERLRTRPPW